MKNKTNKLAQIFLAGAIASGTFYSHGEDIPPLYVKKIGNSSGVCLGLITHIEEGATFNGLIISLANGNEGTINGINLSGVSVSKKTAQLRGLEATLVGSIANSRKPNDVQKIYGVQTSFYGRNSGGCNIQIGGMLRNSSSSDSSEKVRESLLLNYRFGGK